MAKLLLKTLLGLDGLRINPNYAPKWQGVMRKSVAMQDHKAACNQEKPHQGKKECNRRFWQQFPFQV